MEQAAVNKAAGEAWVAEPSVQDVRAKALGERMARNMAIAQPDVV